MRDMSLPGNKDDALAAENARLLDHVAAAHVVYPLTIAVLPAESGNRSHTPV